MSAYIYICVRICTYSHTYECDCAFWHVYVCVCICMCLCMCVRARTCVCVCTCIHVGGLLVANVCIQTHERGQNSHTAHEKYNQQVTALLGPVVLEKFCRPVFFDARPPRHDAANFAGQDCCERHDDDELDHLDMHLQSVLCDPLPSVWQQVARAPATPSASPFCRRGRQTRRHTVEDTDVDTRIDTDTLVSCSASTPLVCVYI